MQFMVFLINNLNVEIILFLTFQNFDFRLQTFGINKD